MGAPAGGEEVGQWSEGPLYEPEGLVHVLFEPRSGEKMEFDHGKHHFLMENYVSIHSDRKNFRACGAQLL